LLHFRKKISDFGCLSPSSAGQFGSSSLVRKKPALIHRSDLGKNNFIAGDSKVRDIDCYEYRPSDDMFNLHRPENFCYCPEFETCKREAEDVPDTYVYDECEKYCIDGCIKVSGCYGVKKRLFTK